MGRLISSGIKTLCWNCILGTFLLYPLRDGFTKEAITEKSITISGRYSNLPIYSAKIPGNWVIIMPKEDADLKDTKIPLISFNLPDGILVTFHTFPGDSLENRIPPMAQIERWKNQFKGKDFELIPLSRCGFGGYCLRIFDDSGMIGYAMQLTPTLFQSMLYPHFKIEELYFTEMRGDFTVKAIGKGSALEREQKIIDDFVKSLKWIYPLRSPL